jgi:hypothetical protein
MTAIAEEGLRSDVGAGKTWMKSTETRTAAVLSMEESGREPPGVGPAGGTRDGGDLVTVGGGAAAIAEAGGGGSWVVDLRSYAVEEVAGRGD